MYNTESFNEVAPTAANFVELENRLSTQANALLENKVIGPMQTQIDFANPVAKEILGNFSIGNEGKPQQMAEAYTKENAPVPIRVIPTVPPPLEQTAKPKSYPNLGEGSGWVRKKPGA